MMSWPGSIARGSPMRSRSRRCRTRSAASARSRPRRSPPRRSARQRCASAFARAWRRRPVPRRPERKKCMFTTGMSFALGDEIEALREMVHRFAQEKIAPRAAEIDQSNTFPRDLWPEMGALGLLGITVAGRARRRRPRLPRPLRRDGGDQPRLGLGRPVLRRPHQPLRQPDPPGTARPSSSENTCRS